MTEHDNVIYHVHTEEHPPPENYKIHLLLIPIALLTSSITFASFMIHENQLCNHKLFYIGSIIAYDVINLSFVLIAYSYNSKILPKIYFITSGIYATIAYYLSEVDENCPKFEIYFTLHIILALLQMMSSVIACFISFAGS
ncbi:MAG: hypothetical protein Harvfovirus50_3 [Harvfovirus sp.]|uniref:Uncharacterized protein n=1 Tax=Harvfovirus sp. TaxID=2487768 RepID=A0A3G5A3B2_9VIRU|nr:MAG: hypothetical protein Harvfovirus50_3 [Harvfovirus sp.]